MNRERKELSGPCISSYARDKLGCAVGHGVIVVKQIPGLARAMDEANSGS
jgi:hypothetical protein